MYRGSRIAMIRTTGWGLALAMLLTTGCVADRSAFASPSTSPAATARVPGSGTVTWRGGASIALADLKMEALTTRPDAMLKVRIERSAGSIDQHGHDVGFVYVLAGAHRVTFADRSVGLRSGQATLVAPAGFTHQHEVTPGSMWLFVSIGDADRAASAGEHGVVIFQSKALASLHTGTHSGGIYTLGYTETLRRLELDPGGKSPLHSSSGYESIYILEGALDLRSADTVVSLTSGSGQVIAPHQTVQVVNTGSAPAKALLFFITPGGEPYELDLPG